MLSKAVIKRLRSLQFKKNRDESGLFPVEGPKMVHELLRSDKWSVSEIYATDEWQPVPGCSSVHLISENELAQISGQKNPNKVFAVAKMPAGSVTTTLPASGMFLLLDQIQDPGNLGTIIRIADWFGASGIFCSPDTVDVFNPKVIQSSMGSVFRILPVYTSLADLLKKNLEQNNFPVYATHLKGENLFTTDLSKDALIILGNESRGLNPILLPFISQSLLIPSKSKAGDTADSLNVAIAAGIFCSEWLRRFN